MSRCNASLKELFLNIERLQQSYEVMARVYGKDYIEELIQDALEIYDSDKTGVHDFALETAGIVTSYTLFGYSSNILFLSYGFAYKNRESIDGL